LFMADRMQFMLKRSSINLDRPFLRGLQRRNPGSPLIDPGRRKKATVTIAIGLICERGIIIASDSQMSKGAKFKRFGERKVFRLTFKASTPSGAAIAVSGSIDGVTYFREILERKARGFEVKQQRDIADLVESAAKETRNPGGDQ